MNNEVDDNVEYGTYHIKKGIESADKPGSVLNSHSSRPMITHGLKQPTRFQRGPRHTESYLALLQVGFTIAVSVTRYAVRSYRTISPLPVRLAVYSLLHFP